MCHARVMTYLRERVLFEGLGLNSPSEGPICWPFYRKLMPFFLYRGQDALGTIKKVIIGEIILELFILASFVIAFKADYSSDLLVCLFKIALVWFLVRSLVNLCSFFGINNKDLRLFYPHYAFSLLFFWTGYLAAACGIIFFFVTCFRANTTTTGSLLGTFGMFVGIVVAVVGLVYSMHINYDLFDAARNYIKELQPVPPSAPEIVVKSNEVVD